MYEEEEGELQFVPNSGEIYSASNPLQLQEVPSFNLQQRLLGLARWKIFLLMEKHSETYVHEQQIYDIYFDVIDDLREDMERELTSDEFEGERENYDDYTSSEEEETIEDVKEEVDAK